MAYDSKHLSALGYANEFTLWHYRTPDSFADVVAEGYFNEAGRMVRIGDFMFVNAADRAENGAVVIATNDLGLGKQHKVTVAPVMKPGAA
jgi:hypothetical protein